LKVEELEQKHDTLMLKVLLFEQKVKINWVHIYWLVFSILFYF
jgi:hypothetical protein